MWRVALLLLGALVAGCAPKIVPAPVVTSPKYPDFPTPVVPEDLASTPAAISQDRAWRFLQSGDLKTAEKEFDVALRVSADFYPAETGLGFTELARKDPKAAVPHFDRALERAPQYVPALVGRGDALVALNRRADALAAFEAALAVDPSLTDIRRRVEVMKFRGAEENLKDARDAARAGHSGEAMQLYEAAIAGSPDSAFLYRELADVERQAGARDRALEHYRKAVSLDPSDARSLVQVGDLLAGAGNYSEAEQAYTQSLAIEPNDAVQVKLDQIRDRAALAAMPEEYKAIPDEPQVTRADLAALIGVHLAALIQNGPHRNAVVITDVRSNWAATWIMAVARAGVMEPFANHTFQPRSIVRRTDLAQAVSRLLARLPASQAGKDWPNARVKFSDMSPGHLAYPAASIAVASGVMTTGADNAFQPSKPVSGAEAIQAIERLEALAAKTSTSGAGR